MHTQCRMQFLQFLIYTQFRGGGGGGGARKSVRTPSSNIVEFLMGIKNLFSKLKWDFKEKYDGLKKGV